MLPLYIHHAVQVHEFHLVHQLLTEVNAFLFHFITIIYCFYLLFRHLLVLFHLKLCLFVVKVLWNGYIGVIYSLFIISYGQICFGFQTSLILNDLLEQIKFEFQGINVILTSTKQTLQRFSHKSH